MGAVTTSNQQRGRRIQALSASVRNTHKKTDVIRKTVLCITMEDCPAYNHFIFRYLHDFPQFPACNPEMVIHRMVL